MKQLGTSDPQTSSYSDVVRVQELNKPYILKFLDGPVKVYSVFYPYIADDGTTKTAMYTVENWDANPLGVFAKIDLDLQKEEVIKRFGTATGEEAQKAIKALRSQFTPTGSNHYLGLDKSDVVPIVRRIQVGNTVRTELTRIENQAFSNPMGQVDETKLHYGLAFMLWFDIRKVLRDPKGKEVMNNIIYSTKVVEDFCKFKGHFEPQILSADINVEADKVVLKMMSGNLELPLAQMVEWGMFTEDEYSAVVNYDHGIKELTAPMTRDEIMEKLVQNPVALNAKDKNGKFLYPSWEQIAEKATKMKLELPFTTSAALPAHEEKPDLPEQSADDKALEALLTDKSDKPKEWMPAV